MKVSLKLISDTEQEEAKLYVHEETDNIKRLERYRTDFIPVIYCVRRKRRKFL